MNEQAERIVNWYIERVLNNEEYTKEQQVVEIYNGAMEDARQFIREMIKHNPQYRFAYERLLNSMFPGLKLGDKTQ